MTINKFRVYTCTGYPILYLVRLAFAPLIVKGGNICLLRKCGNWNALFGMEEDNIWKMWRYRSAQLPFDDRAENITDREQLPADLTDFKLQFEDAFMMAGFYDIDLRTLHRL